MEFDEIENFLAVERERRKTDRERELELELQRIAVKHREELVAECGPIYAELAEIDRNKPPMPIVVDGKVYEYTGPRA